MPTILSESITAPGGEVIPVVAGQGTMFFPADLEPQVSDIVFYDGETVYADGEAVTIE